MLQKKRMNLVLATVFICLFSSPPITAYTLLCPANNCDDIYTSIGYLVTIAEEDSEHNGRGNNNFFWADLILANSTATAETTVIGIDGSNGKDAIHNNEPISVNIFSDMPSSVITGIGIDAGNGKDNVINRNSVDVEALVAAPDTKARAIGINAGNGKDMVTNQGSVDASATSIEAVADKNWKLIGNPNTEIQITTQAEAVGINGDSGNSKDELLNTGELLVSAAAGTSADAVTAVFSGKAATIISLSANASAVGIDGGDGKDFIQNEGEIVVDSEATTESLGVSLTYAGIAGSNRDAGSPALVISTSTGLSGGNGMDEIANFGFVKVTSSAAANAENVALSAQGTASADSSLGAIAEARGIEGGLAKDVLTNAGNLDVTASASSFGLSADVNFVDVTQTDLTRNTESTAVGIDGGMADDKVSNSGTLTATAISAVEAWNLDFNGLDTAIVDSSITANSTSTGMTGGKGRESLFNSGELTSKAISKIQSWTFELSVADIVFGNASTTANATATGIDASEGDEYITNQGSITADSFSEIQVGGITLSMVDLSALQDIGKWIGIDEDKLKLGNAGTILNSAAVGIRMDPENPDDARHEEDDVVINHGDVTAKAVANALSVGVSIGAEGVPAGLLDALAFWDDANLADAGTIVNALATGIDAAHGENFIDHNGVIIATAEAKVNGVNVGLGLPLLEPFMDMPSPAFTLANEGSSADAMAAGIKTGDDADNISSAGEVNANADAQTVAVSASLIFQGIIDSVDKWDIAFGRTDVTTSAAADANGITVAGGDDAVTNSANVTVDAEALSIGAAVSMAYQNKVEKAIDIEGTLADTSTSATATARAINLGEGNDAIENSGMLIAKADSQDIAVSLSGAIVNEAEKSLVINGAIARTDAYSKSDAKGIDAGDETDTIINTGAMDIDSDALAVGAGIALTVQGSQKSGAGLSASLVSTATTSETNAVAIDGGTGISLIDNSGDLDIDTTTNSVAASIGVTFDKEKSKGLGFSLVNAQNSATSSAMGIVTDEIEDIVYNTGNIDADASTTAVAASISFVRKGVAAGATIDPASFDSGNNGMSTAKAITTGAGDDEIVSNATLTATAATIAPSVGVSIAVKGVSAAVTTSDAEAEAVGIEAGAGMDTVQNSGEITAEADSTAVAISVAISKKGLTVAGDTVWDGGTTATAATKGIDVGAGDDQIANAANIKADSNAIAPSIGVSVSAKGVSAAISTASSKADAIGIYAGQGDDSIYNTGNIETDSMANADAIAVSITGKGVSGSADDVWDGGVEASATGSGIDAGPGASTVINKGIINSDAEAVTVSAGVAIVGKGVGVSVSTSTAEAEATGINLGDEAGAVHNKNEIITDADSTAVTVNVDIAGKGVVAGADEVWDGGTKSIATTTGIRSGADSDHIKNESKIDSEVDATTVSAGISVVGKGVGLATSTSTATGLTTGIETGAGSDIIDNSGVIETESDAIAVTASVSVAGTGIAGTADAVWDGGTKAGAASLGINAGTGDNIILNTAKITSESDATTVSAGISVAGTGIGLATSTSTALAGASGINTDSGVDTVFNTGELDIDAAATAVSAQVSVVGTGIAAASDAVWDGGTQADAAARGINTAAGNDVISNGAVIDAETDAVTVSAAISVAGTGVGVSMSEATASAESIGIASGSGEDTITNTQTINTDASSTGVGVSVSVTGLGISGAGGSVWDGGTKGYVTAKAIDGGQDNDAVTNSGALTAESSTTSTSVGVAIAGKGIAFTTATSTAVADTTGIDVGKGNDVVNNTGAITANAESDAVTVQVSVAGVGLTGAADSVWDNGTTATATARGIYGADGLDDIWNEGDIISDAEADTSSIAVSATIAGVAATTATSLAKTEATAIDGGSGNDTIVNKANLTASAESDAITVAVSAVGAGVALAADSVWDNGTTAEAIARGAYGNQGDDNIQNEGNVVTDADADTTSVAVTVALAGVAGTIATSTAVSESTGFDGGIGDDTITSIGNITSTATANADTVTVSVAGIGAALAADSVWDGGTTANAAALGFSGGSGNDILLSDGLITTVADAETDSTAVTAALAGIAGTVVSSTALAESTAMDGGSGVDIIESHNVINSTAISDANTVQVSISGIGASISADSAWDGGTTAIARANGLNGGADNDSLLSREAVNVSATAISDSTAVAVTLAGIASTTAVSNATSIATGIDGGTGSDMMESDGAITAIASAEADALSVSVAGLGVAAGDNPFWDHTTTSTAIAGGLKGGTDNDTIVNYKSILAGVKSDAQATEVSVALLGVTFGDTATAAYAYGTGIDGGDGEDVIFNEGSIIVGGFPDTVVPMARAEVDSVGVSLIGAAIGDASTTAGATSRGIDGGSGNDIITNKKAINATATSASDISATTVGIIGYAGQEANAISVADATGITGGSGNDSMLSTGALNAYSASTVTLDSAAFTFAGATDAKGSTTAVTRATGFSGEAGEDYLRSEAEITADAISTMTTDGNTTAVFGSAGSEMTSGAVTISTGIDGGDDNDIIENAAIIDVSSTANLSTSTSGFTLGGTSSDRATMAAITGSSGITGGSGDDSILNTKFIDVEATSFMTSSGSSTTIFGTSSASASSGAVTSATGIYGGEGIDIIESIELIDVSSSAALTMSSSSFSLFGKASAEGALTAWTESSGILGGDGADTIISDVGINVSAIATLNSSANSDAVFGSAKAKGTSGAVTNATGINSGAGHDIVESLGTINSTSLATLILNSSAFTFGGTTSVNGALAASTESRGIVGGTGEDSVFSKGAINLTAASDLTAQAKSETVFGKSTAGGTTLAQTNAYGIDTGAQNDIVSSTTNININTITTASTNRSTYVFGGGSATDAVMRANAESAGISAGSGNDWVSNGGNIILDTSSSISSTGYAYAEFGGSQSHGLIVANSTAQGIDAGDGDDIILNDGNISLKGMVSSTANHQSETGWLFGDGDSASEVKSVATKRGISLGNGENTLLNSGNILARLGASTDTYSYSDGADIIDGNAKSTTVSTTIVDITGVQSGNGGALITNEGDIDIVTQNETYNNNLELTISPVIAKAVADTDGDGIAGDGSAYATAIATATSAGIIVGDGENIISNSNTGQIKGIAKISGYAKTTADADEQGTDRTKSTVELTANAFGIKAGNGDSTVINNGSIVSTATPDLLKASAVSDGDFAVGNVDAESTSTVTIKAIADGISIDDGNSKVINSEDSSVVVMTMISTHENSFLSKADGDGINGDGDAWGYVGFFSDARAIGTGNGSHIISNDGMIQIFTSSNFDGTVVSDGDEDAHAKSRFELTSDTSAIGIKTGNGTDYIANTNLVEVKASPKVERTYANSDGGSPYQPVDSTSNNTLDMTATATGISAGDGNKEILNTGEIFITSEPYAEAKSRADGDSGTGVNSGDGWASATTTVTATAHGILTGVGENFISNGGKIQSYSSATAKALTTADGDDYGDATADSKAYAYAYSYGLKTSSGNDTLNNTGEIISIAEAIPKVAASADGGWAGDSYSYRTEKSEALSVAVHLGDGNNSLNSNGIINSTSTTESIFSQKTNATSIGIEAGAGNDSMLLGENSIVTSSAGSEMLWGATEVYSYGINAGDGNNTVSNYGIINTEAMSKSGLPGVLDINATGIKTGDGNDSIYNAGSINTLRETHNWISGETKPGIAIDSSAGEDIVALVDGSDTIGDVLLGSGNDILNLTGTPALTGGLAFGGSGIDTAYLYGSGYFNGALLREFENGLKTGSGTYIVPNLPQLDIIEVVEGRLLIDNGYQFNAAGKYIPHINPDGTCGTVEINGIAGLAGKAVIAVENGAFVDGTKFNILSYQSFNGSFAVMSFPDSPILTFNTQQSDTGLDIEVDVASFKTVADNGAELKIAEYLDRLTMVSAGELNDIIGEFQMLSRSDFDQAFASVNPEPYSNSVKTYIDTTMKSFDMVQSRINTLRTSAAYAPYVNQFQFQNSFAGLNGIPHAQFGLWFEGFTTPFYDDKTRLTGPSFQPEDFFSLGFDTAVSNNFVLGFGRDYSQISTTTAFTDGMNTVHGHKNFVYSSFNHDDFYMNMAAFYGNESYNHHRDIRVGVYEGTTVSEHASDSFLSYVEMGRLISSYDSIFQPFVSLRHMSLKEDGFAESGGGVLALKIEDANRELLTSHLGFRASKLWVFDQWTVMPELSLAWRYHIKPVDYSTTASFVSMPSQTFVIEGEKEDEHALDISASLNIGKLGKLDFSINFNGEILTDKERGDLGWEIKYRF